LTRKKTTVCVKQLIDVNVMTILALDQSTATDFRLGLAEREIREVRVMEKVVPVGVAIKSRSSRGRGR
jgi:hypothetical protein